MKKLLILFVLLLSSLPSAVSSVKDYSVSPSSPVQGDVLRLEIWANPHEEVDVEIMFEQEVAVSGGKYQYKLEDVVVPNTPNRFTVKATGVDKLVVAAKRIITISLSKDAVGGKASISAPVPGGKYDVTMYGDAAPGEDEVTLEFTAKSTITVDSDGYYLYEYDTSSLPPGEFTAKVGGETVTLVLKPVVPPVSTYQPPDAQFTVTGSYSAGEPQTFNASGSSDPDNDIDSYSWSFGDGEEATRRTASHVYAEPGEYTVTLTVTDRQGLLDTASKTVTINEAPNKPPTADAGSDRTGFTGENLTFTSLSVDPDGEVTQHVWEYGDGSQATGATAEHSYSEPGNYTVTLTVTDDEGLTAQDQLMAIIAPLPEAAQSSWHGAVQSNTTATLGFNQQGVTLRLGSVHALNLNYYVYEGNPFTGATLPLYPQMPIIDVTVSNPDSVAWPIHLEWNYSLEVPEVIRAALGVSYYSGGEWRRCADTGVNTDEGYVWVNLQRHELYGSPLMVSQVPPAPFMVYGDLMVIPGSVEERMEASAAIHVTNTGNIEGDCTVVLYVDDEAVASQTLSITPQGTALYTFTLNLTRGEHAVSVGSQTRAFNVLPRSLPDLTVAYMAPGDGAASGDPVNVTFTVTNIGNRTSEGFEAIIQLNELTFKSLRVGGLEPGESETVHAQASLAEGENSFLLHVDPGGDLTEFRLDNNVAGFTVFAEAQSSMGTLIWVVPLLVLATSLYLFKDRLGEAVQGFTSRRAVSPS